MVLRYVAMIILLSIIDPVAWAEDWACGTATALTAYIASRDPTRIGRADCTQVPEVQITAQRDLVRTVPQKYLKVRSGLAAEMTQVEKDAVDVADAPIIARADDVQLRVLGNKRLTRPTELRQGDIWAECAGTSPARTCSLYIFDGGATRTVFTSVSF